MEAGTLISYFTEQEDARNALRKLRLQGFRRLALVMRTREGAVQVTDPFYVHWLIVMSIAGVLFSASCGFILMGRWPFAYFPTLILGCTIMAASAAMKWLGRARFGVETRVIRDHARWLVSGECVLILQAPVEALQRPVALLRESGDIPPALFILHPRRERRARERSPPTGLSPAQMQEYARRHAQEQQLDPRPQHSTELLKRLKQSLRWVRQVCRDLTAASRLEQKATPVADWILDNEYILEGNARDVLLNLPRRFYQKLPALSSEPYRGLPSIYGLAKDLVSHTELRLDRENILAFIEAYQSVRTLTIGELWAVPQMLRVALIESIQSLAVTALANLRERQLADFWANRLIAANRRDPNQLFALLAELAASESFPTPYFGGQLVGLLYDEAVVLLPVQGWLERTFKIPLRDLNTREQNRQTREQLACGNAFTSLRQLSLLDWRDIFEKLSRVEQTLRHDPSAVYARMDFATRDRCRRAIEELARSAARTEEYVSGRVIELATKARDTSAGDERSSHVATWLIGEGRPELAVLLGAREAWGYRFLHWIYRHHASIYSLGVGGLSAFLVCLIAVQALIPAVGGDRPNLTILIGLLLLLLIPVSQLAIEGINYLITRFLPPRSLPKMDFAESGIPDEFRTLVVVPMMLVNIDTILAEAEKLEIRYLANKDENLLFSLFTDYTDSATSTREDDDHLIETAKDCLIALNRRYGGDRFFLFHRQRAWSDSEQKFIGWERKRGKLEELNRLIEGSRPENAPGLVAVGDPDHLKGIRFIITLDSDTRLPHGTARRLVETLAHPLNQPRFDGDGRIMPGTYTIIQPRVSPTLPSTSASFFSRLFADAIGIDPYTQAISDVYQDLSGEGSYHGKGIYDVRAFSRVLSGRFPEDRVLSHDLIEGAHVRVGLATDIELFDEFPQGYQSYASRAHRWIRGDWQIAGWIFPTVPLPFAGRGTNPLSLFNRWKIFDNLRRSLVPATSLGLLTASWFVSPELAGIATAVICAQLLFHPLAQPFTMAMTRNGYRHFSLSKLLHDLLRTIADAALLPHQAAVSMDAILRVWYRRAISHRGLLQWSAQATHWSAARRQLFVGTLALGSLFALFAGYTLWKLQPASLILAAPWLGLWFLSPLIGWLLNLRPRDRGRRELPVSETDTRFLRQIARRTWRYFSAFVGDDTSWLPPDNYQASHREHLAMRTSPTNIGLWMSSVIGAHDSGYLTVDQVISCLTRTMETIGRLERYQGHLLNWYDIQTLNPLEPRYVSTVDSGNLLAALWAVEQGLRELGDTPLLGDEAVAGLRDTSDILQQNLMHAPLKPADMRNLHGIARDLESAPISIAESMHRLRGIQGLLKAMVVPGGPGEAASRVVEMQQQVTSLCAIVDRYLNWIEILAEKSSEEIAPLGPDVVLAIGRSLLRAPSLGDLAQGQIHSIGLLRSMREQPPLSDWARADSSLIPWMDRVIEAYSRARWLAGEARGQLERLILDTRELSQRMDMAFLYNRQRKLFAIGYNVSADRLDTSNYDLLASEARLGSFVSIARGDVPLEHWFSMSRPYGAIGHQRVLLSWTGTMFEYLMPLLFQRSYRHSLLDRAAREALNVQIAYGRRCNVPWGISESAFADLDINKTYQYRAFGVPSLGLKRGLEEKLVIAPYATLLAVRLAPTKTVKNLRRLEALGLLGDYGYYEAMDFSRPPQRETGDQTIKRGVIIEAYMAHHLGMGFIALVNFLHRDAFQRRFHSDSRVSAFEALLQERIPLLPPLHLISMRQSEASLPGLDLFPSTGSTILTPHTAVPRTLLLSNGRYGLMITNGGGGFSHWNGRELTRWRSDVTCDSHGSFCYVHETDGDRLWSATFHPVGGRVDGYEVDMGLDRAVFRRMDHGIHTETEICVSPEDDVEVRRVTLINRSSTVRHLRLTSYFELSMTTHEADRQHPAFNKLFIQTEALHEQEVVLAHRRPRSDTDLALFLAHRMTLEGSGEDSREADHRLDENGSDESVSKNSWQFETDRRQFIGRGHSLANPAGAIHGLSNRDGYVLDPILSLQSPLTLEPGQHVRLSLVLAAADSREGVLSLMDKYSDPHAIARTLDFAWGSAQQELQILHIQPDEALRFQQLAGHLLYPGSLLRAPAEHLEENRRGQAGLWPYGISGDLPLVLIRVGEGREIGFVRQMLQAHTYWRMHGLSTDLILLNEEDGGYDRPLQERLEQLIQNHTLSGASDRQGGIFLRNASQIPAEDLRLLKAAASVMLVAARGTLPRQLGGITDVSERPETLQRKRSSREPSAQLPFMELHYFNGLGGFTPDGREYAIYLGPGTNTPAPWVNVISNPNFGTMVSESGSGFTWAGNSQRNRLTAWSNDPVLDPASEAIYIRDEETGAFWSPTMAPIREDTAYRARHGAGYTVFEHNSNGIEQELTVFVPVDETGGDPIKLQRLRLKNATSRGRTLSVTYYVEWTLGENRETSRMHVVTNWDEEASALLARNSYHPEYGQRIAFAAVSTEADSYGADRTSFIGRNRSLSNPAAMEQIRLSHRTGAGLDPCAAIRVVIELAPWEQRDIICMLGQGESATDSLDCVLRYRKELAFEQAFDRSRAWWDALLNTVEVHTPELATDLLVNRWLQYQSLSCRIWGRSAFYQSGGAFGFRDQLQDVMAFLHARPALAREQILLAASRQFKEGDVQHWWHPPHGAGIRSLISDDMLWLPYVVAEYVQATGDTNILSTQIPFLNAPVLASNQHEQFLTPEIAFERGTLFEHCHRAVQRGLTMGPHGLPLMGTGDWNDGMNLVGAGGKGESVWLAWFLCDVLQRMADLSDLVQQNELGHSFRQDRMALIRRVEAAGWDGHWYLRGTFDNGSPIGSATNTEACIDSLPQSWAWLSGAANSDRAAQALESAWQHLVRPEEGLVLLFDPPFDRSEPSPGYIKGYPPGVRENGGQYTHAALWLAMAMARRRDGQRAVQLLRMLNPIEHTRHSTEIYRVEPYVVAADVYHLSGHTGQGGWSWYTGSAAWMYRAWVEEVFGLHVFDDSLELNPIIPSYWPGFSMRYRHGQAIYTIDVQNPLKCEYGVSWMEMDGQRLVGRSIPLERGVGEHHITVRMGPAKED